MQSTHLSLPATRHSVADELERLAEETGDAAFSRAARALFQESPGRPAIDDTLALQEVHWLLSSGQVRSRNQAIWRVALAVSGSAVRVRSTAERLRRKLISAELD